MLGVPDLEISAASFNLAKALFAIGLTSTETFLPALSITP